MTRRIPLLALLLVLARLATAVEAENPHGPMEIDCAVCHDTGSWAYRATDAFDHDRGGFVLRGGHAEATCADCHRDPRFRRVASACADCHVDVHDADLGYDCAACHDEESWLLRGSVHGLHAERGFPMVGSHAAAVCEACHPREQGFDYGATGTECIDCHESDYRAAAEPDHVLGGYDLDCSLCHSPVFQGWTDDNFRHDALYRLTGAHRMVECAACHALGYMDTPTLCFGCHADDFAAAVEPDHAALQFDEACELCHGTVAWTPASYDHALTAFPLTGAHIGAACLDCHVDDYAGTPRDCDACHGDLYAGAEPDHPSAGFGRDCQACHDTTAWFPSTWNHDEYFPIASGEHREAWSSCLDCHPAPGDYGVFSCIDCHEHGESEMNEDHDEEQDYVYESAACLDCHPRGDE